MANVKKQDPSYTITHRVIARKRRKEELDGQTAALAR
jgi:hypothetical protein